MIRFVPWCQWMILEAQTNSGLGLLQSKVRQEVPNPPNQDSKWVLIKCNWRIKFVTVFTESKVKVLNKNAEVLAN